MKISIFCFLFSLMPVLHSQTQSVNADVIIDQINNGEDVRYENTSISGTLDFTALDNQEQVKEGGGLFGWFGGDNDRFESEVKVSIEFINCTFVDDVVAYYNDNNSVFVAHFSNAVIFERCEFMEETEFKYSKFEDLAVFAGNSFGEDANFKYAEFKVGPDFRGSRFEEEANFKYAKFKDQPDFSQAIFNEEGNFKYAKFPSGVTFEGATFEELANFKYSEFSEPFSMKNVKFNGDEDFKYTQMEGKSFSTYLLKNRP